MKAGCFDDFAFGRGCAFEHGPAETSVLSFVDGVLTSGAVRHRAARYTDAAGRLFEGLSAIAVSTECRSRRTVLVENCLLKSKNASSTTVEDDGNSYGIISASDVSIGWMRNHDLKYNDGHRHRP